MLKAKCKSEMTKLEPSPRSRISEKKVPTEIERGGQVVKSDARKWSSRIIKWRLMNIKEAQDDHLRADIMPSRTVGIT